MAQHNYVNIDLEKNSQYFEHAYLARNDFRSLPKDPSKILERLQNKVVNDYRWWFGRDPSKEELDEEVSALLNPRTIRSK